MWSDVFTKSFREEISGGVIIINSSHVSCGSGISSTFCGHNEDLFFLAKSDWIFGKCNTFLDTSSPSERSAYLCWDSPADLCNGGQWRVQCGRRRKYKKGEVGGGDLAGDRSFGIDGGRSWWDTERIDCVNGAHDNEQQTKSLYIHVHWYINPIILNQYPCSQYGPNLSHTFIRCF